MCRGEDVNKRIVNELYTKKKKKENICNAINKEIDWGKGGRWTNRSVYNLKWCKIYVEKKCR